MTINAGTYDTIKVLDRGTLTLNGGVYNAKVFLLGTDVKLILHFPTGSGIEVNALQTLFIGDRINMSFSLQNNPTAVSFYSNGTSDMAVGYDGIVYGSFTAPNAKVIIHDRTSFSGTVYGKKIELQPTIFYVADTDFPTMSLCAPVAGSTINTSIPKIKVCYNDALSGLNLTTLKVFVNGIERTSQFTLESTNAWWQIPQRMALVEGTVTVISTIEDRAGNAIQNTATFNVDVTKPVLDIVNPSNASLSNNNLPLIKITYSDAKSGVLITSFDCTLDGSNISGKFSVASPVSGYVTNQNQLTITWTIDGVVQTEQITMTLAEGENVIIRSKTDAAGNVGKDTINVTFYDGCAEINNVTLSITADNTAYEGRSLCISNSNVAIYGVHTFDTVGITNSTVIVDTGFTATTVILQNSSMLTHLETTTENVYGLNLTVERLVIDATSKIDVSGRGYVGDKYVNDAWRGARTEGNTIANISHASNAPYVSGGSHGGRGGCNGTPYLSPVVYGAAFSPILPGSGGGAYQVGTTYYGGNGGGVVHIDAKSLTINGTITANGMAGASNAGSGAGGSVWIIADTVSGTGSITATGGSSINSIWKH